MRHEGPPIDVMQHQSRIVPVLMDLIDLDKREMSKTSTLQTGLFSLWGELDTPSGLKLVRQNQRLSGISLNRKNILNDSGSASVDICILQADAGILAPSKNPQVHSSLLIGASVLGLPRRGANAPEFSAQHFDSLLNVSAGIQSGNQDDVIRGLRNIKSLIIPYEQGLYGRITENDDQYRVGFGPLASIAKIIDTYYAPAITRKETSGASVENSVLYGTLDVMPGVLGATIKDSIVATRGRRAFANAHCQIENVVVVLDGNDTVFIEKGRNGYPDLATEVVRDFSRFQKHPLAAFTTR